LPKDNLPFSLWKECLSCGGDKWSKLWLFWIQSWYKPFEDARVYDALCGPHNLIYCGVNSWLPMRLAYGVTKGFTPLVVMLSQQPQLMNHCFFFTKWKMFLAFV
jgi:hypothetical protein